MLPRGLNNVLKYILLDPENHKTNDIVYGLFSSSICYKFNQTKEEYVYIEHDFGLRKWRILNSEKEQLYMGDMKENNLQLLRFSRLVFPDDLTLKILYNNLTIR